jgi:multiple sugar transport system substrate-binding protein
MKQRILLPTLMALLAIVSMVAAQCAPATPPPPPPTEAPPTAVPTQPPPAAPTQPPPTAAPTQPAATTAPSTAGEKVTLRLWSHSDVAFQKANEELVARFIKQNPNVEIKYESFDYDTYIQNLQTSMAASAEADVIVMFGSWVCSYARGGRLMEVPAEVMTYEKAKEIYFPSTLGGYYCDGKFYGLPNESNLECGGALVNPALFEKHGVPYPPKWEKFSDLIADAVKMTEFEGGTMTRAGFHFVTADGLSSTFLAGILEQGGSYFAPDGKHFTFDTPEARKIIQLMVDLAQKYKVVDPVVFNNDNNRDVTSTFFPGEVAIGYVGSWGGGEGRVNYPDMKFDYVEIPTYFGGERRFAADAGWGEVVSVNTKHPAEAWKLAKFMAADQENALFWNSTTGTIPAMKAIAANPGKLLETAPWVKPTFDLLPHGQYIGDLTDHDQLLYEIIYPHILEAMQGLASVEDTAKIIDTEANAMVDAKK